MFTGQWLCLRRHRHSRIDARRRILGMYSINICQDLGRAVYSLDRYFESLMTALKYSIWLNFIRRHSTNKAELIEMTSLRLTGTTLSTVKKKKNFIFNKLYSCFDRVGLYIEIDWRLTEKGKLTLLSVVGSRTETVRIRYWIQLCLVFICKSV